MKFNWRTKRDSLPLAWKYTARGSIWRLMSSDRGTLILEERNPERKEVYLASIDARSGIALWSTERFRDRWWLSIETLHGDVLFLHEYATPDMPDHKKIIALSLVDGAELWTNEEMKFLFARGNAVYAAKDHYDGRSFYELDIAHGGIRREVDDALISDLRSTLSGGGNAGVRFPLPFGGGESDPARHAVRSAVGALPGVAFVEVIDAGRAWIVGWYQRIEPDNPASPLRHDVAIVDASNGAALYNDRMDAAVPVPVPDLFICRDDMAYYIKERSALCAVRLTSR